MEILLGLALFGFLLLAIIGRRAARIILISGIVGMVLLFAFQTVRRELRSGVIRQETTAAIVPLQCPPAQPGVKMTEAEAITEAYRCYH